MVDETVSPQDRPSPEDVFAERVAPLVELVERWRARIGSEAERSPAVPPGGLARDAPRRLPLEIAEELPRARGHPVAAVERVRAAAELRRRRMLQGPDGEPGS